MNRKFKLMAPLSLLVLLTDCTTKALAVEHLSPPFIPHQILGDFLRFTLAYNPGAAFSMSLGAFSRPGFLVIGIGVLFLLGRVLKETPEAATLRLVALGLIVGGALGNLLDRVRSARGVVDFIDMGVGAWRFWTFNVADMGVSIGAVLLAISLWQQGQMEDSPIG